MKNIVIWPREADLQIVKVAAAIGLLVLVGLAGLDLPSPLGGLGIIGVLVAVPGAVFAWSVFELVKPAYFTRKWRRWQIVEFCVLPIVWGLLMAVFGVWLNHQATVEKELLNSIVQPVIAFCNHFAGAKYG